MVKGICKLILAAAVIFMLPAVLFASGSKESDSVTGMTAAKDVVIADQDGDLNPEIVENGNLLVYSYEETVTDFFLNGYVKKYPEVNVKTAVYGELDEAIAKMRGGFKVDVLNPCTDYIPLLKRLNLIQPIDVKYIPRWNDIMDYFKNIPELDAGGGKVWMIPSDAGLEGIMYNTEKIKTPPDSWMDLWNPEFRGHIAMQDYARNSIAVAALALGYSDPFHLSDDQLEKMLELTRCDRI
jgi:spermidine/putrescine transport system substrate-binding protein